MIENKTIIFFDGDGTLWYPKAKKYTEKPHLVYKSHPEFEAYKDMLMLTPSLIAVLKKLKRRGITLVVLSTHPHLRIEADIHLASKVKHLKVDGLFDDVLTARPFPWGKGKVIERVLKSRGIPKSRALMIGDSYTYDYLSARKVGVDCVLIRTPYTSIPNGRKVKQEISRLSELTG